MYALASFLGAFLLFFLEPYLGKVMTPRFGGGAQVWLTCLLFYQAVLLAGYGLAHWWADRLPPRFQARLHLALLLACLLFLGTGWARNGAPLGLPGGLDSGASLSPFRLLGLLASTAGLPMVALSATAPLLQSWYARLHPDRVPYRLYAASNLGSLAGLGAYPFLAERLLSTGDQGRWIAGLFLGYGVVMAAAASRLSTLGKPEPAPEAESGRWGGLDPWLCLLASTVGAGLLMATTNVLTTEVATIPLLWVLPLACYLLTFVVVFEGRIPSFLARSVSRQLLATLVPFCLSLLLVARGAESGHRGPVILGCAGTVTFGCLATHGYLYALRPQGRHLTAYYLRLAVGGVLGGLAVALAAPMLFDRNLEFGIACLWVGFCALLWLRREGAGTWAWGTLPALAALLAGGWTLHRETARPGRFYRDFFGVAQVQILSDYMVLRHGHTIHGAACLSNPRAPLAYFAPPSGVGRALLVQMSRKPRLKVGVVGLGVGTVVDYGRPGDEYTFYEISPKVLALSGPHPTAFPLLRDARCRVEVREGDGRSLLDQELRQGSRGYDLLLVDAFAGDVIPWHLLTVEAFRTYLGHLAPGGILALHVSNPLAVDRVALSSARALDLHGVALSDPGLLRPDGSTDVRNLGSNYLLLAKEAKSLDHPFLQEPARLRFGPGSYGDPSQASGIPCLKGGQAWTDRRNSLSDLLFERRAF